MSFYHHPPAIAPSMEESGAREEEEERVSSTDATTAAATAAKCQSFFDKVMVPDEKNFLPGVARDVVVFVDEWMVEGERVDIIKDGKVTDAVDMGDAWKVWEEWDGRER